MIRIAQERIADLFALAATESQRPSSRLPDRYVALARRIGMRYNIRILPEYRTVFCRRCSAYWIEGRTVRTRLRGGQRVRTCLACGAQRRFVVGTRPGPRGARDAVPPLAGGTDAAALVDDVGESELVAEEDDGEQD